MQTEDAGARQAAVFTHVFIGGRVVGTRRASYAERLGSSDLDAFVRRLVYDQHRATFVALRGGEFDSALEQMGGRQDERGSGVMAKGEALAALSTSPPAAGAPSVSPPVVARVAPPSPSSGSPPPSLPPPVVSLRALPPPAVAVARPAFAPPAVAMAGGMRSADALPPAASRASGAAPGESSGAPAPASASLGPRPPSIAPPSPRSPSLAPPGQGAPAFAAPPSPRAPSFAPRPAPRAPSPVPHAPAHRSPSIAPYGPGPRLPSTAPPAPGPAASPSLAPPASPSASAAVAGPRAPSTLAPAAGPRSPSTLPPALGLQSLLTSLPTIDRGVAPSELLAPAATSRPPAGPARPDVAAPASRAGADVRSIAPPSMRARALSERPLAPLPAALRALDGYRASGLADLTGGKLLASDGLVGASALVASLREVVAGHNRALAALAVEDHTSEYLLIGASSCLLMRALPSRPGAYVYVVCDRVAPDLADVRVALAAAADELG